MIRSLVLVILLFVAGCKPATNDAPSSGVHYGDALYAAAAVVSSLEEATGGKYTALPVLNTGSMKPYLHGNAVVVIEHTTEYSVGDWIAFRWSANGGMTVLHRVESVDPLVVKGIANAMPDSQVRHSDVYGRLVAVVYAKR